MVAVSDLLTRAGYLLNDEGMVTWTEDELLAWINDGAAQIITRRPPAGAVTETLTLNAGALQELGASYISLLDLIRNIKSDDSPGKPIERTSRRLLDSFDPDWYEGEEQDAVVNYTFDDRDPTKFYVYPPVADGTKAEALVAKIPSDVAAGGTLDMDEAYVAPLVSYVVHRGLSKDSEFANGQAAQLFYRQFLEALGAQNETTTAVSANRGEA